MNTLAEITVNPNVLSTTCHLGRSRRIEDHPRLFGYVVLLGVKRILLKVGGYLSFESLYFVMAISLIRRDPKRRAGL